MRIAIFMSHPIQYFSPLWGKIAAMPKMDLTVFYYSKHGLTQSFDTGFGSSISWDIDLLAGYQARFLPRCWPTTMENDCRIGAINKNIGQVLREGWDVAYVSGYAHINNWNVAMRCRKQGIPLMMQSDSNIIREENKSIIRRLGKHVIVRLFYKQISVYLCTGDHNRNYLLHYGAPAERIRMCLLPSDVTRFQETAQQMTQVERDVLRQKYNIAPGDFVVCVLGKLIPLKRPFDVIAAINKLNRVNIKILFVGSGPLHDQLAASLGNYGTITGFVNQSEIPRVLSICDVLVMSSNRDAYGLAVTEAQAVGLPVILSDKCGCYGPNAVFRDGESGYLYPCGDVDMLSQKIALFVDQPAMRERMGKRASELAKIHSVEYVAEQFVSAAEYARRFPRKLFKLH